MEKKKKTLTEILKETVEFGIGFTFLNGIILYEPLRYGTNWKQQLKDIKEGYYGVYEPLYRELKENIQDWYERK